MLCFLANPLSEFPKSHTKPVAKLWHSATIFIRTAYSLESAGAGVLIGARIQHCKIMKIGAPRPMKMGTIASPWRYDIGACHALQSVILRWPAIFRYGSRATALDGPITLRQIDVMGQQRTWAVPGQEFKAAVWTKKLVLRRSHVLS
jgi:hypothetical protein